MDKQVDESLGAVAKTAATGLGVGIGAAVGHPVIGAVAALGAAHYLQKRFGKKAKPKKLKENYTSFRQFISEQTDMQSHVDQFCDYACQHLGITDRPTINLVDDKKIAQENASFGGYFPGSRTINVNVAGRHPVDVLRTLAHELVHHKQNEDGKLGDVAMAGETGSDCENEANSQAGIMMRNYGRSKPSIYESYNK
jgi:hypothetical protein